MSTIIGLSFVAPTTARLAYTLAACAALALVTSAPASRDVDAPAGASVVEWQASADPAGDRDWTNAAIVRESDACDDDDDGGDESSSGSGPATFDRDHVVPGFGCGARLVALIDLRHGSRVRDAHLLRGPPASARKSFAIAGDDTAVTHHSRSGRGTGRRAPHVLFPRDPFRSARAASDHLLRAPP